MNKISNSDEKSHIAGKTQNNEIATNQHDFSKSNKLIKYTK